MKTKFKLLLFILLSGLCRNAHSENKGIISGKIISTTHEVMDYATVLIKGTGVGSHTDKNGLYHIPVTAGTYTLLVRAMGYEDTQHTVTVKAGERIKLNIKIKPKEIALKEVAVEASQADRINRSAYNAVAVDLKNKATLSKNLCSGRKTS